MQMQCRYVITTCCRALVQFAGDGEIDVDEFEYVLSNFKVPPKDCKVAFTMFSMVRNFTMFSKFKLFLETVFLFIIHEK